MLILHVQKLFLFTWKYKDYIHSLSLAQIYLTTYIENKCTFLSAAHEKSDWRYETKCFFSNVHLSMMMGFMILSGVDADQVYM